MEKEIQAKLADVYVDPPPLTSRADPLILLDSTGALIHSACSLSLTQPDSPGLSKDSAAPIHALVR